MDIDVEGLAQQRQPSPHHSLPSTWLGNVYQVKRKKGFLNAVAISSTLHRISLLANLDKVAQAILRSEGGLGNGYPRSLWVRTLSSPHCGLNG